MTKSRVRGFVTNTLYDVITKLLLSENIFFSSSRSRPEAANTETDTRPSWSESVCDETCEGEIKNKTKVKINELKLRDLPHNPSTYHQSMTDNNTAD